MTPFLNFPSPLVGGLGIGVDAIPAAHQECRHALGKPAALCSVRCTALPDETDVNEHKLLELSDLFMEHEDDAAALEKALFEEAGRRLEQSDVDGAWMTLLAYNPG